MRIDIGRLIRTVKDLKINQLFYRIKYLLLKPNISLSENFILRDRNFNQFKSCNYKQTLSDDLIFKFLNQEKQYKSNHWQNLHSDLLWLYNLHYFDDLNSLNAVERFSLHKKIIFDWIQHNPIGIGVGWEAYPNSLRIVNWIKWLFNQKYNDAKIITSLIYQVRFLNKTLEYHLMGNHLLANAKALIFAGSYFDGIEGNYWLRKGTEIFNKQLDEQILADGCHFERSPMYHRIILVDLLDLINLYQVQGKVIPRCWITHASRMIDFMINFSHPDQDVPFFNDATYGISCDFNDIKEYASRLNVEPSFTKKNIFKYSGFACLNNNNICLLMDIGSVSPVYQPGHSHASSLSIESSIFGERFIVNSGISTYNNDKLRLFQRSTCAHNTIEVDNRNSSEIWSSFRVGRKANVLLEGFDEEKLFLKASHDGYKNRGIQKVIRSVRVDNDSLLIRDKIARNATSCDIKASGRWYFSPEAKLIEANDESMHYSFSIIAGGAKKIAKLELIGAKSSSIKESKHYIGFNKYKKNIVLEYEFCKDTYNFVSTKMILL